MATKSKYKCKDCEHEFEAQVGSLMRSTEFRCEENDHINYVKNEEVDSYDGACKECGGQTAQRLSPMCPQCKSRSNEVSEMLMNID